MQIKRRLLLCLIVLLFGSLFLVKPTADSFRDTDFWNGFSVEDFTEENVTLKPVDFLDGGMDDYIVYSVMCE